MLVLFSDQLFIHVTPKPCSRTSPNCACSLWFDTLSSSIATGHVFTVLWMMSCFHIMALC